MRRNRIPATPRLDWTMRIPGQIGMLLDQSRYQKNATSSRGYVPSASL